MNHYPTFQEALNHEIIEPIKMRGVQDPTEVYDIADIAKEVLVLSPLVGFHRHKDLGEDDFWEIVNGHAHPTYPAWISTAENNITVEAPEELRVLGKDGHASRLQTLIEYIPLKADDWEPETYVEALKMAEWIPVETPRNKRWSVRSAWPSRVVDAAEVDDPNPFPWRTGVPFV